MNIAPRDPTTTMVFRSITAAAALLAAGALALSACTSNSGSSEAPYAGTAAVSCGGKQTLTASGSTAQAGAIKLFIGAYQKACENQTLNYTANGSGAGTSEFISGKTDFGGSDSPMTPDQITAARHRCRSDAWELPVVFGGVAITYNLNAVNVLVLDAPTIAKIFTGAVTRWDDPAITALNESMPSEPIHVVYRSDASGTTDNFQRYLTAAAGSAWPKGAGQTFNGGTGVGFPGNEGTSAAVKNTKGAVTYNEWSFAQQQMLPTAQILTPASKDPVIISGESVGKTIDTAKIAGQGNDLVIDTSSFYKPTRAGAYPMVLASYELVCSKYPDPEVGRAVKAFLQAAIGPGQAYLSKNGYSPIPADFRTKVSTAINAIA
jgi:phosphate transport system substrate-binding protein